MFVDKKILGLSFGSKLGGIVRHCHPLNDNPRNPYCRGVEGLLESYKATLNNGTNITQCYQCSVDDTVTSAAGRADLLQRGAAVRGP